MKTFQWQPTYSRRGEDFVRGCAGSQLSKTRYPQFAPNISLPYQKTLKAVTAYDVCFLRPRLHLCANFLQFTKIAMSPTSAHVRPGPPAIGPGRSIPCLSSKVTDHLHTSNLATSRIVANSLWTFGTALVLRQQSVTQLPV